jgi:glycine/D-amino acid oxidase-like deaminating enzyme
LPTAVRSADGRFAWRAAEGSVLLCGIGAAEEAEGSLEAFATRLPVERESAHRREEEEEVSIDGLPLVGRLSEQPLAVACGFGALSPGFAFAAARWAADALLSGADPTPEPLRVTRRPVHV